MPLEPPIPALTHPDPFVRAEALDALAADPHTSAAEAAAYLLADEDVGVREQAARVLIQQASPEAAGHTVPYIASGAIAVRNLAGEVLVKMGPVAIPALVPYIDDPDHDVRKFAIDVLALLPAAETADRMVPHLTDPDPNVVLSVIDALGAFGAAEHAEQLRAIYEREPLARPNVVTAIGAFRRRVDLTFLEAALSDEDPSVQLAAAEALAGWPDEAVTTLLLRQVERMHPMARPVVLKSLIERTDAPLPASLRPDLLEMLDDPDGAYQRAAIAGLRPFMDDEVAGRLLSLAGRTDTTDVAIFQALAAYPGALSVIARATEAGHVTPEVTANFTLGLLVQGALPEPLWAEAVQLLADHFEGLEADTKLAAVTVSQQLAHPALHPLVRTGLRDRDPAVRSYAADAAAHLGVRDAATA